MKKQWLYAAALTLAIPLAACDNNSGNNSVGPTPLSDLVRAMFAITSDVSLPIQINALQIDTSSEDSTVYTSLLI